MAAKVNVRTSQYSKDRKSGTGRKAWSPDLKEWTEACALYPYDKHIFQHFFICSETFYFFLEKERCKEEAGKPSEFLAAYKNGRNKSRHFALKNILDLAATGDASASIFVSKSFGGLLEARDIEHIELKKEEMELKKKAFLTELANKFGLNPEQLEKFAKEYFTPVIKE